MLKSYIKIGNFTIIFIFIKKERYLYKLNKNKIMNVFISFYEFI